LADSGDDAAAIDCILGGKHVDILRGAGKAEQVQAALSDE
jgi:hypothetical protein